MNDDQYTLDQETIDWLTAADEPWTRLRTRADLLGEEAHSPAVRAEADALRNDGRVHSLVERAAAWPGYALKRHNDAKHPLYAVSTLADFGLTVDDPQIEDLAERIIARQDEEGAFLTRLRLYKQFGGLDGEYDAWMLCDAPTLLYALLSFGLGHHLRVEQSVAHLRSLCRANGWPCAASSLLGDFKGPGKRSDPCPMANLYALKALSLVPQALDSLETRQGCEALLAHWEEFARASDLRGTKGAFKPRKLYLFGVGTDFRKLKYPFIWYDILHVADVLSRFPFVHGDPRYRDLLACIAGQADEDGRFTAGSMYRAWAGYSFAEKTAPSPWLTFLVLRIRKRTAGSVQRFV